MKLTPAAANLLVHAADRADRQDRITSMHDMRAAVSGDAKAFDKLVGILKK